MSKSITSKKSKPLAISEAVPATKFDDNKLELPSNEVQTDDDNACIICYETPKEFGLLGCKHSFCYDCIINWSKHENTCPLCKLKFRTIERKAAVPQAVEEPTIGGSKKRVKKSKPPASKKVKVKDTSQSRSHHPAFGDMRDFERMMFPGAGARMPAFPNGLDGMFEMLIRPIIANRYHMFHEYEHRNTGGLYRRPNTGFHIGGYDSYESSDDGDEGYFDDILPPPVLNIDEVIDLTVDDELNARNSQINSHQRAPRNTVHYSSGVVDLTEDYPAFAAGSNYSAGNSSSSSSAPTNNVEADNNTINIFDTDATSIAGRGRHARNR